MNARLVRHFSVIHFTHRSFCKAFSFLTQLKLDFIFLRIVLREVRASKILLWVFFITTSTFIQHPIRMLHKYYSKIYKNHKYVYMKNNQHKKSIKKNVLSLWTLDEISLLSNLGLATGSNKKTITTHNSRSK